MSADPKQAAWEEFATPATKADSQLTSRLGELWDRWQKSCESEGKILEFSPELAQLVGEQAAHIVRPYA